MIRRVFTSIIFIYLCVYSRSEAQGITDINSSIALATQPLTTVFTLTGSAGTKCVFYKVAGTTINTAGNCVSGDNKDTITMPRLSGTSTISQVLIWGYAEIECLAYVNKSNTSITAGTLPGLPAGAPANGIGLSCSNGAAVTNYTVSWP